MTNLFKTVFVDPADALIVPDEVNVAAMRRTVEFLTSLRPPRNADFPQSLNAAAAYIEHEFHQIGLATDIQEFNVDGTVYRNVIGVYGAEKSERMIVGAHYDVCGDQPGADDNASAIAGLMEIARIVNRHGRDIPYRVDFIAYTLEEPPFFAGEQMGSYVHAKSLHEHGVRVHGMVCLEMIGYYTDEPNSQKYPIGLLGALYPSVGDFIAVVGNLHSNWLVTALTAQLRQTAVKVEHLVAPAIVPGIDFSDNRNYWTFGYPAVMVTDTAFYRNPHYHLPTDTIETLDFDKMAEVVKAIISTLLHQEVRPHASHGGTL